jgi:hypothetical protein
MAARRASSRELSSSTSRSVYGLAVDGGEDGVDLRLPCQILAFAVRNEDGVLVLLLRVVLPKRRFGPAPEESRTPKSGVESPP